MNKLFIAIVLGFISISNSIAQSSDEILNLLVKNKTITQFQADSIKIQAKKNKEVADSTDKHFFFNKSKLFQLSGYTQIRYQNLAEKNKKDDFDISRARIGLEGDILKHFGYGLQFELIGSSNILDIYGEWKISNFINLRFGQFKVPFSLENLTPFRTLELTERSQVVDALVIQGPDITKNQPHLVGTTQENFGRDRGIQVSGRFLKIDSIPRLYYSIGIFNGSGINKVDNNESKSVAGRLVFHSLKGLDLGVSFYEGYDYYGPDLKNNECSRLGFEFNYEHKRFSFRSEYILGKDDYSEREGMMDIREGSTMRAGWYAQTGLYIIPQKLQLLIKLDRYKRNIHLSGISDYYVFGLNYNLNKWMRIQTGYYYNKRSHIPFAYYVVEPTNTSKAIIQFQIGF